MTSLRSFAHFTVFLNTSSMPIHTRHTNFHPKGLVGFETVSVFAATQFLLQLTGFLHCKFNFTLAVRFLTTSSNTHLYSMYTIIITTMLCLRVIKTDTMFHSTTLFTGFFKALPCFRVYGTYNIQQYHNNAHVVRIQWRRVYIIYWHQEERKR